MRDEVVMGNVLRDDFVTKDHEFITNVPTVSFDLITSKFFSDCGSSDAESVIELSSYGRKKVFLAILKPEDAAQYGLADKSWSVCTVTEHVKRNTFLVSHSLWAHS